MGSSPGTSTGNARSRRASVDDRGVSPVVGKLLEIGVVTLYIGLLVATLYGGVVPDYRAAAGTELGERTLASAAQRIEDAVPPDGRTVDVRYHVSLPETIAGASYAIQADGETLVLDHPNDAIEQRTRLAVPSTVTRVTGRWQSGARNAVVVSGGTNGLVVTLTEASS